MMLSDADLRFSISTGVFGLTYFLNTRASWTRIQPSLTSQIERNSAGDDSLERTSCPNSTSTG